MDGTILLFYKYVAIQYPKQQQKWHLRLCKELGLTGRIILAHEGINGTVGGTTAATDAYKAALQEQEIYADIDFKESPGSVTDFPRCTVLVKQEIVRLGLPGQYPASEGGRHISPHEAHQLLQENAEDLIVLDGRNNYESQIGSFVGSITPDIGTFREFPDYIQQHCETFRNKRVLMACTGGIRCERASAYLKAQNVAQEVMQISGGIHRYLEQFPDGFFRGKNYVFDGRIALATNNDILTICARCKQPEDSYTNCINTRCNTRVILCATCANETHATCSETCKSLIEQGIVTARTKPARTSCSHAV
jgi:predicted sulfurtransferase